MVNIGHWCAAIETLNASRSGTFTRGRTVYRLVLFSVWKLPVKLRASDWSSTHWPDISRALALCGRCFDMYWRIVLSNGTQTGGARGNIIQPITNLYFGAMYGCAQSARAEGDPPHCLLQWMCSIYLYVYLQLLNIISAWFNFKRITFSPAFSG